MSDTGSIEELQTEGVMSAPAIIAVAMPESAERSAELTDGKCVDILLFLCIFIKNLLNR